MRITADMSLYPLTDDYKPTIIAFIKELQSVEGLEVVVNQLSTQLRGEFELVTGAVQQCLRRSMEVCDKQVLVVKYLSADLDIASPPELD